MSDTVSRDDAFRELRAALLALAAEGSEAPPSAPERSVKAVELALAFDKVLTAALAGLADELTEEQRAALLHVNRQLSKMGAQRDASPWTEGAVRSHPDWAEARSRARAAALLLGWIDRPHSQAWPARPLVPLLVLPFAVGLALGAVVEGTPWLLRVVLGGLAVGLTWVALGALVRTTIEVDPSGSLSLRRSLLGVDVSRRGFSPGSVSAVELVRRASAERASRRPKAPIHGIYLVHPDGRLLIARSANATAARAQAERLARAVGCPLHASVT